MKEETKEYWEGYNSALEDTCPYPSDRDLWTQEYKVEEWYRGRYAADEARHTILLETEHEKQMYMVEDQLKDCPHLVRRVVKYKTEWNPNYDPNDTRDCECGHKYYRHFDSYDDMRDVGCKYSGQCNCQGYKEKK